MNILERVELSRGAIYQSCHVPYEYCTCHLAVLVCFAAGLRLDGEPVPPLSATVGTQFVDSSVARLDIIALHLLVPVTDP